MRSLVIVRPGFALLITQDIRRSYAAVTGQSRVYYEPGTEQAMASQLGCTFIARIKHVAP